MTISSNPPIDIPLESLSGKQKWELVQMLCEDMAEHHPEDIDTPAWHEDALKQRLDKEARGETVWHSVDETFQMIRTRIANERQS